MGKNGWEARLEKYGLEAVVKELSESGEKGWEARVKKHGREAVLEQSAAGGSVRSAQHRGVRQERADEKQQILESLVQSGEPFWIKVKKGDITAKRGQ